jgi:hypothetical protein
MVTVEDLNIRKRLRNEVFSTQMRIDIMVRKVAELEEKIIKAKIKNEYDRIELRNVESRMESEEDEI